MLGCLARHTTFNRLERRVQHSLFASHLCTSLLSTGSVVNPSRLIDWAGFRLTELPPHLFSTMVLEDLGYFPASTPSRTRSSATACRCARCRPRGAQAPLDRRVPRRVPLRRMRRPHHRRPHQPRPARPRVRSRHVAALNGADIPSTPSSCRTPRCPSPRARRRRRHSLARLPDGCLSTKFHVHLPPEGEANASRCARSWTPSPSPSCPRSRASRSSSSSPSRARGCCSASPSACRRPPSARSPGGDGLLRRPRRRPTKAGKGRRRRGGRRRSGGRR